MAADDVRYGTEAVLYRVSLSSRHNDLEPNAAPSDRVDKELAVLEFWLDPALAFACGVEGVDLQIGKGEIFGFLGPNGAGKTTTIRTLMDEIRPTAGTATIVGLDTHRDSVEIRKHIGYIPGDLAMYPNLTGRDTLTYFSNLRGGVDWTYVDKLAARLEADLSKKIGDLSTGNRQKVGIPCQANPAFVRWTFMRPGGRLSLEKSRFSKSRSPVGSSGLRWMVFVSGS